MEEVSEYDGIGIGVFDGFCTIDIDHCHNNGVLSDMAKNIIATMNSYTEYSPSGEGIRILFRADSSYDKAKYYINNQKLGLEIYVSGHTNKYVTLTGDRICGDSILANEKYKGSALLQKKFTIDFLQKKMKPNEGEVPQYYVEHSHPPIIPPDEWERVQ